MNINSRTSKVNFTGYASGSIASFTGLREAPINIISQISAIQSGSGTPAPDNIRPISGWSECNVVRCGANVWDEEWESGTISNTGELQPSTTAIRSKNYCRIAPNTSYYRVRSSDYNVYVVFYDKNLGFISRYTSSTNTFTTPANAYYFKLVVLKNVYENNVSINYPATDTDYHAYTGNTYTIQFGDTYYGGSLNVTTGELTVTWGNVDLGSLNYQYNANTNIFTSTNMTNFREPSTTGQRRTGFLCDIYPPSSTVTINANMDDKSMLRLSGQINIRDTSYISEQSFKSAMSGHQIVYSLATPLTVQLDRTVIWQMIGDNSVYSDSGNVEVYFVMI